MHFFGKKRGGKSKYQLTQLSLYFQLPTGHRGDNKAYGSRNGQIHTEGGKRKYFRSLHLYFIHILWK